MNAAVVIPYVDRGCPHRRRAHAFVLAYWYGLGLPGGVVSCRGPEPFSRAAAINSGVQIVTGATPTAGPGDADVILQSDPDSIVTYVAAREALRLAAEAPGLVIAHSRYLYLDRDVTDAVLENTQAFIGPFEAFLEVLKPEEVCDSFGELGVGNVVAFSRETWELAGGYDERFGTWGADDGAFALACGTLAGEQRRVAGDMLHFWHPRLPESAPGNPEYERSMQLAHEYHAAAQEGAGAMRALVTLR